MCFEFSHLPIGPDVLFAAKSNTLLAFYGGETHFCFPALAVFRSGGRFFYMDANPVEEVKPSKVVHATDLVVLSVEQVEA